MIMWILTWLYFRFEFLIDWGKGANLVIDLLPSVTITISHPDPAGFRMKSIGLHFLIFSVTLSYYYPAIFLFDEEGEVVGKNVFPEASVSQMD